MNQTGPQTPPPPEGGPLDRETADEMLTALQSFERVARWGFRAHQHPDDPGPAAQATLFFLQRHQPVRAPDPDDARAALTS